jgi:hypothetical protein
MMPMNAFIQQDADPAVQLAQCQHAAWHGMPARLTVSLSQAGPASEMCHWLSTQNAAPKLCL